VFDGEKNKGENEKNEIKKHTRRSRYQILWYTFLAIMCHAILDKDKDLK